MEVVRRAFRALVAPGPNEAWSRASRDIGAEYTPSSWLNAPGKVVLTHQSWQITMDSIGVRPSYTRLRAPYMAADSFQLSAFTSPVPEFIARMLGLRDFKVDVADFDKAFRIQGSSEDGARQFFSNEKIRKILSMIAQRQFVCLSLVTSVAWADPIPPDAPFQVLLCIPDTRRNTPENVELIERGFELVALVLDRLCELSYALDTAAEEEPF